MGLVEAHPPLLRLHAAEASCVPRVATGMGAGMARHGEVCGALLGAAMGLSLRYGRENASENEAKEALYSKVDQLLSAFEAEFGSVRCIDLTGCDMRTPEGRARVTELDLHHKCCPKFVAFAARFAEST